MLKKIPGPFLAAAIIAVVIGVCVFSNIRKRDSIGADTQSTDRAPRFGTPSKLRDIPMSRFDHANTLRNAKSDDLVTEVRKVLDQYGMFADVFPEDKKQEEERLRKEKNNIAVTLHDIFSEYYMFKEIPGNIGNDELQVLLKRHWENSDLYKLWEAIPDGTKEWNWDKPTLDKITATLGNTSLARLESKRQAIRKKLKAPDTFFGYFFVYPKPQSTIRSAGKVMNTEASKYLGDYALLEEYAIARTLQEGKEEYIWEAIEALDYIFRITYLASILEVVGVRSDAAIVRLQAFEIMQRVILDPQFEKQHLIALRNMLSYQHDHWTPESETWFGDRASGIAFYHRLTMEGVNDTFETEDMIILENRWGSHWENKLWRGFRKNGEADETFYLRSMQKILDVSKQPFSDRLDVLSQINADILKMTDVHDKDGVLEEPIVASILLKDVEGLMRLFARDESALTRALVAIYVSLGQTHTDKYCDPFTGKPFDVQKAEGWLSISAKPFVPPFRVPNFTNME